MIENNDNILKVLVLPDLQIDYHDKRSCNAVLEYVATKQYDEVIQLGDFLDYDFISRFVGRNKVIVNERGFNKTKRAGNEFLDQLEQATPGVKKVVIQGNHDFRVVNYINDNPELKGEVEIENALEFERRGIEYIRFWEKGDVYKIGHAIFIHGLYYNEHHAAKTVDRYGTNVFYGHCVSDDTEILTKNGWKLRKDINIGTIVATMNKETFQLEWQPIRNITSYDNYKVLYHLKGDNADHLMTPEHGMVAYRSSLKSLSLFKAEEFLAASSRLIPMGAIEDRPDYPLSDSEIELLVWICADGHLAKSGKITLMFKKERKALELLRILKESGVSYTYSFRSGYYCFYVKPTEAVSNLLGSTKKLPNEVKEFSPRQAELVFRAYDLSDGHTRGQSIRIYSTKEDEIDTLQILAVTSGYRAGKTIQHNEWKNSDWMPLFVLNINSQPYQNIQRASASFLVEPYDGIVWCPTVDNGTVFFRRNGKVIITQNTHDVQSHSKELWGDDKTIVGQSCGCLCKYDQPYIGTKPTRWQQAFVEMNFLPNGYFGYNVNRIFNHRFITPEGKVYKG